MNAWTWSSRRLLALLLTCGIGAMAVSPPAAAQNYPTRSITMIVPFAAGGPTDTVARVLGQALGKSLGQTIVIENLGGAGGTLAAARAAKAAPDGYTIFINHLGQATAPALYKKLPYDPIADFAPIGLATDATMVMTARTDFPANTLAELIGYVKQHKDTVSMGHAGVGAASHLCELLFMSAIDAELTMVAYRGTAPAMTDLLGGQIELICDQATSAISNIKAGKVKAYAVTTPTRIASMADVPTSAEAGLPVLQISVWHGLYAPKGTPKPVIDRLVAALQAALDDPVLKERYADLATEPVARERATPEALAAYLRAETDKWGPIIAKAGVHPE
jgi:tripartite-type tricarboxylate transporter receptor subunit TctC